MGGLSCIQSKPKKEPQPTVREKDNEKNKLFHMDSLKLLNRNSLQVYCGDPKPEPDKDKPLDGTPSSTSVSQNPVTFDRGQNPATFDKGQNPVTFGGQINNTNSNDAKGNLCVDHVQDAEKDTESESKDCVLDIIMESNMYLHSLKYNPQPHVQPVDPNSAISRRPKSLDSAVPHGPVKKSRPLSYSPGLLKTKQPASLNSESEAAKDLRPKRPQSIDMQAFFEAKGFDIHTQKLRNILLQEYHASFRGSLMPRHIDQVTRNIISPNQVENIDEAQNRYFRPSQMMSRKTSRHMKLKEVNYLKKMMSRPRMKFSKSLEMFFQHCEQYFEYDPFLDIHAAQPSNPWITDDETLWEISKALIEVPPVKHITMWALSFKDLLSDQKGHIEFEKFLQKEYSQENIRFYKACTDLIACPQSEVVSRINTIEKEFLMRGAVHEVNVDCKTLDQVVQQLKLNNLNRFIFQPAMDHVYALMKKDSYTRFLRSDHYKQLLLEAQTHYNKKKFFHFGGSNRKKNQSLIIRHRCSTSGDIVGAEGLISGASYHSYSTGNLQELDSQQKHVLRSSYVSSDNSINVGHGERPSVSPSLQRKTENMQVMVIDSNQNTH